MVAEGLGPDASTSLSRPGLRTTRARRQRFGREITRGGGGGKFLFPEWFPLHGRMQYCCVDYQRSAYASRIARHACRVSKWHRRRNICANPCAPAVHGMRFRRSMPCASQHERIPNQNFHRDCLLQTGFCFGFRREPRAARRPGWAAAFDLGEHANPSADRRRPREGIPARPYCAGADQPRIIPAVPPNRTFSHGSGASLPCPSQRKRILEDGDPPNAASPRTWMSGTTSRQT